MSATTDKASLAIRESAAEWAARLSAADLSPADKGAFAAWLRISPVHVREYLNMEALRSALAEAVAEDATDIGELLQAAPSNIVELDTDAPRPSIAAEQRPRRRRLAVAIAASVLFVAGAALAVFFTQGLGAASYATGIGELRRIALSDGSTVELNTDSKIRVNFHERRRDIQLVRGEAFFIVARDAHRPFTVTSSTATVRAVGTQFSVYRKPGATLVTVVEGKVLAQSERTALELGAGQQTVIASGTAPANMAMAAVEVDASRATAWRQNRLIFDNQPLSEVIAEFNRYNRQQLFIDDPQLALQGISGVFDPGNPQGLLLFLSKKGGVEAVASAENSLHLRRRP